MTATDTVNAFIGHLNAMRLPEAWSLLAPDVVYHNIPLQPVVGPDAVAAVLGQIPMQGMDWIILHSAEHDGHVLNERTDRFHLTDGRWVELRVMGIFEVFEGRITAWRDYFDLGQWASAMAPGA
jgi:limonene-1,2-epoxide hydrolase